MTNLVTMAQNILNAPFTHRQAKAAESKNLFDMFMAGTGATAEEAELMILCDITLAEAQAAIECENERQALLAELTRNGMDTWEAELIAEEMADGLVYA
jgi:hypothetical protein